MCDPCVNILEVLCYCLHYGDIGGLSNLSSWMGGFQVLVLEVSNFQHCVVAGMASLVF